jgi:protein-S-isoprenylcysteine O-methyltransferase Ste14
LEFIPSLAIGWLNGWVFLAVFALTELIHIKICSKGVVIRLFDRKNWTQTQIIFTILGKVSTLINIILFFLSPFKIVSIDFVIGVVLYSIGLVGLHVAIYNFRKAPLDKPITTGLYKISRNPQIFTIYISFLGICLVIGSWISIILLTVSIIGGHFGILGEEKRLFEQYGESYAEYKKKVPRYFLFF